MTPLGETYSLPAMLVGGLFLYVSYYGCDQSQAQRLLTARDDAGARAALVWNGLLRFPLVLTYCFFGLLLAGLLHADPRLVSAMEGRPADSLVPVFLTQFLPAGLRGLLLAAILAAAMSSIDSALNSLAAVTLEDVLGRPPASQGIWTGRATALAWGVFAVGSGLVFAHTGAGIIELINQIGSVLYGPVLAVFVLGVMAPAVNGRAAMGGLGAGIAATLLLAWLAPRVSWLWWNPTGFAVACLAACVLALPRAPVAARAPLRWPPRESLVLGGAFVAMLGVLLVLPRALEWAR
jgi:SSS family solute:Na+ symporter